MPESWRLHFERRGWTVSQRGIPSDLTGGDIPDAIMWLADDSGSDVLALEWLSRNAAVAAPKRPRVFLMLRSASVLRLLLTVDFPDEVNEAFDIYPFTVEQEWARSVLVRLPGIYADNRPALDRVPIEADSDSTVHLVIFGSDSYAEALARQAALVAHYPNYRPDEGRPLRTRITMIAPGCDFMEFRESCRTLLDHSFWRTVDVGRETSSLYRPMYDGEREDFVDVEWEFVSGSLSDAEIRRRLSSWSSDPKRQLTIAITGDSDEDNIDQCMSLPPEVFENGIPVWLKQHDEGLSMHISANPRFSSVCIFGMDGDCPEISLALLGMARMVHFFYMKGVQTEYSREEVDRMWRTADTLKMRNSNLCNVMTMTGKLRSIGHDISDMNTFYALSQDEVEALARTEHNRWSVERLLSGSRPCTDGQRREIRENIDDIISGRADPSSDRKTWYKRNRDIHLDLCSFSELGRDAKGRDVRMLDYDVTAAIPLMVKTLCDWDNG